MATNFKVTHTYPKITPEENEKIKKNILMKMYNLYNQNKKIETKIKISEEIRSE